MSRPLRIEYPDAWYHVMNRGGRGQVIFESQDDFQQFIDVLKEAVEIFSLRVSAFCLMSNHYHLLVQTPDSNLSRCMRHINGIYTQRFNAAHGIDGPLFRGRYKSILVNEDSYLLQLVRYIHKNPLRAGMVSNCEDYVWSSHRGYLSKNKKWDWLHKQFILSMLCEDSKKQKKAYQTFMSEDEDLTFLDTMSLKKSPAILGDTAFIAAIKNKFFEYKRHLEVPESKQLAPESINIINAVCEFYAIDKTLLYNTKRGNLNEARSMAIYLHRQLRGDSLIEIGQAFGISNYSSVSSSIQRFKMLLQTERTLQKKYEALKKNIKSQE